jgi:hypothetical protein
VNGTSITDVSNRRLPKYLFHLFIFDLGDRAAASNPDRAGCPEARHTELLAAVWTNVGGGCRDA